MTREGSGSIQPPETAVITSKVSVPPRPEQLVARPRVERQLRSLIDRHRVVVVSATAGAGKTTAVAEAVLRGRRRVAWLAVDRTDALPGRLLAYLEAALARQLPHLAGAAMRALAAGIPHAEAAGLLAEAVGDEQLVLVVEDLERLDVAREAWAVIESLLRYAPRGMRIVLVSRHDIPAGVCELPEAGAVPALREADLAFTPSEAAEALARQGQAAIDAAAAVEATGG